MPGDAKPEDAEALGVVSFDMMISLLGKLRDKGVLSIDDGVDVMLHPLQAPLIPGIVPPYTVPERVRRRLEGEILLWRNLTKRPGARPN